MIEFYRLIGTTPDGRQVFLTPPINSAAEVVVGIAKYRKRVAWVAGRKVPIIDLSVGTFHRAMGIGKPAVMTVRMVF